MKKLEGRVAVITGAGSGIGRATALRLAERGCALALVDIDAARLAEVTSEVEGLEGRNAKTSTHTADVSDAERMRALVGEVVDAHGAVHILVNNAGVSVIKTFEEHSLEDLQWQVGINFWGVVYGCHFFLPELRKADEAHIVNLSSMFGFMGVPGQSSYCATKFAVKGLSESLWAELDGSGIGVTSIHPGGVATNIAHSSRGNSEDDLARLHETTNKYGHPPDDVAKAIVRGIEKNRLRMIVGQEAYVVDWLKRLFPLRSHRWIARRMNPNQNART